MSQAKAKHHSMPNVLAEVKLTEVISGIVTAKYKTEAISSVLTRLINKLKIANMKNNLVELGL